MSVFGRHYEFPTLDHGNKMTKECANVKLNMNRVVEAAFLPPKLVSLYLKGVCVNVSLRISTSSLKCQFSHKEEKHLCL